MKLYISFGQGHAHHVNNHTFDKDTIAVIKCDDYGHGRGIAWDLFGDKFGTSYTEEEINKNMHFFPKGQLPAN